MTDTPASPGAVAMDVAAQAAGKYDTSYSERQHRAVAAIIQRAIDAAVAPVEASRNHEHDRAELALRTRAELALRTMELMQEERNAARAAVGELRTALAACKQACLFVDDDGQIGVTEDAHIPSELFDRVCAALDATRQEGEKT